MFFIEACLSRISPIFCCRAPVDVRAHRLGDVASHRDSGATFGTRLARLKERPSPWKGKWDREFCEESTSCC